MKKNRVLLVEMFRELSVIEILFISEGEITQGGCCTKSEIKILLEFQFHELHFAGIQHSY